jgi:hypothetical protein
VSDEILAEFESAQLMIEKENGDGDGDGERSLIVNPRYYELEQYLETKINPAYKRVQKNGA